MNFSLGKAVRGNREDAIGTGAGSGDRSSDGSRTSDLETLLAHAFQGSLRRSDLRSAVCLFTDDRQRMGEPIEKILVQLKEIVAHARAAAWPPLAAESLADRIDDVTGLVVRSCIERFYDQSGERRSTGESRASQ